MESVLRWLARLVRAAVLIRQRGLESVGVHRRQNVHAGRVEQQADLPIQCVFVQKRDG